ncbi:MAG TPA: MaoC/PaaZ C-terminal domain-containing protein [Desulfobacteraceae bacterium]|nr:MaoC/PaaZ C-terminal domain-containing protein [Desulfobacteraceae bacterium]
MSRNMRKQAVQGLKAGDTFVLHRTFLREETEQFGDVTRDYNPVHYDERWTRTKGFDGLICHGLLVGGMICEFGGQVGWLASGMDFKFIRPVYFNDTIECRITITRLEEDGRAEASAGFFNQHGTQVAQVLIKGILPGSEEKEVLTRMMAEGDPTNGRKG